MPRRSATHTPLPPLRLDPQSEEPLYLQVQNLVRGHIEANHYQVGDRLPSLQQISKELGVAYATVARGMRGLVEEGVLEAKTARGTVVAPPRVRAAHATAILAQFSYGTLLRGTRYYRGLLFHIQEYLVERGQTVAYNHWPQENSLQEALENLPFADSAILFGVRPEMVGQVKAARRAGLPLVCVGDTFLDPAVPAVHTTNEQDAARLVRVLRAQGHEHIVTALPDKQRPGFTIGSRLEGVRRAMVETGRPATEDMVLDGSPEQWVQQMQRLSQPPTALIMLDNTDRFGRLHNLLRGTALEPGRQLEVALWDESLWNTVSPLGIPYLSVEQPLDRIAELAVGELLKLRQNATYQSGLMQVSSSLVQVDNTGQREYV